MDDPLAAPMTMGPTLAKKGVRLHDVPDHFFDSTRWNEYLSFYPNRQAALAELQPEPAISRCYGDKTEKYPWLHTPEYQSFLRRAKLRAELLARFKEQLIEGKLATTGFSPLAVERVVIPAERWQSLQPDFVNDRANDGTLEFTGVRVSEAAAPTPTPDLLAECIEWMTLRGQEGESRRKVLQRDAKAKFGSDLTTRLFDTVYKQVFAKRLGRPPRNPPKP